MNTETALAHLEAFIAGGDELGDVPEDDAIEALQLIRETLEKQEKEIERLRAVLGLHRRQPRRGQGGSTPEFDPGKEY